VYLDNILIYTKTIKEHCKVTRKVLHCLEENNLYHCLAKCNFECTEVEYLGMLIREPNDVPEGLWQVVGQDLITGLPNVKGFNAIATFMDHYGKQVHVVPTTDKVDSNGIAEIHHRDIFRLHGIPQKFILDWGPQFASCVMHALLKQLGVEAGITTAYHLQANGQTERMNCEVATYLRMFCNQRKTDWVDQLPTAEFALNNRVNNATGFSPFYLTYGYQPDFTVLPGCTNAPAADQRLNSL
jgi:hypothetical protein